MPATSSWRGCPDTGGDAPAEAAPEAQGDAVPA